MPNLVVPGLCMLPKEKVGRLFLSVLLVNDKVYDIAIKLYELTNDLDIV